MIQAVISTIDIYEQDKLSVGNENQKIAVKEKWNRCNHITMLSLLGKNHRLPLFYMAKIFIWIEGKKQGIHKFSIGYMINPKLNINKAFR